MTYDAIAKHDIFYLKMHYQQHFGDVADQQTDMLNTMSIKVPSHHPRSHRIFDTLISSFPGFFRSVPGTDDAAQAFLGLP